MKFSTNKERAFLQDGKQCFSLVSDINTFKQPYVCYYADTSKQKYPFALTKDGIQVPTKDGEVKNIAYEDLQTLVDLLK